MEGGKRVVSTRLFYTTQVILEQIFMEKPEVLTEYITILP